MLLDRPYLLSRRGTDHDNIVQCKIPMEAHWQLQWSYKPLVEMTPVSFDNWWQSLFELGAVHRKPTLHQYRQLYFGQDNSLMDEQWEHDLRKQPKFFLTKGLWTVPDEELNIVCPWFCKKKPKQLIWAPVLALTSWAIFPLCWDQTFHK